MFTPVAGLVPNFTDNEAAKRTASLERIDTFEAKKGVPTPSRRPNPNNQTSKPLGSPA